MSRLLPSSSKIGPILNTALDYLYPPACHHCATSTSNGRYLCATCFDQAALIEAPFCQQCGEMYDGNISNTFLCPNCHSRQFSFDFARAALRNTNENHQLIIDLKYLKQFYLAGELARYCANTISTDSRFSRLPSPVLIPVPLHWRRSWQRGFNQAEEISRALSKLTSIPYKKCLKRTRHTQTQTKLDRKHRLHNLQGAFQIRSIPKHFRSAILIDDVFTTGSTAEACSSTLRKHAPQLENIVVLTALRG
ncbi:ComF family protein [Rubritalea spongiae]|uniref:ComF family protein n=1 Tax=Rubritalea spongiae TaxID=430797 RepID=A0ABW5DZL1_9BACT